MNLSQMIVVDTDILIDTSRGIGEAIACLEAIEAQSVLAISTISEMELIVGCRDKNELRALQQFLGRFEVIKVSEAISAIATELLKTYRLSHSLLIADALIAATAISFRHHL